MEMVLISGPELRTLLRSELSDVLTSINKASLDGASDSDQLLKRSEVAQMFSVSLVTVHAWMKSGVLPFHRIGGRTFFKKHEVVNAMKQVKLRRK
jgi:excisionase family DNA binding protein